MRALVWILALVITVLSSGASSAQGRPERWGVDQTAWITLDGPVLRNRVRANDRRRELERAAEAGDIYAKAIVAGAHASNLWRPGDPEIGFRYAQEGALAGDIRGMVLLAECYRRGWGVAKDENQAALWALKAADSPIGAGLLAIYMQIELGDLVSNPELEVQLEWAAAGMGSGAAMNRLGWRYLNGIGLERNVDDSLRWTRQAVDAGNPNAHYSLATMYGNGIGVTRDPVAAAHLMEIGAGLGDPEALYGWGWYLYNGFGTQADRQLAARMIVLSAEGGSIAGKTVLADLLTEGEVIPRDYAFANELYEEAAAAGNTNAMTSLGFGYQHGTSGRTIDRDLALAWYGRAVEAGAIRASYDIATVFDSDPTQRDQAVLWYRRAAEGGYEPAVAVIARIEAAEAAEVQRQANAERARAAALESQRRVALASALRAPQASSTGAPTASDILAASTRMRADAFGWRTTSIAGQLIVPSAIGDMASYQRSVSRVSCSAAGRNTYNCSYHLLTLTEPVQSQTLGGLVGNVSALFATAAGMGRTDNYVTHQFVREGNRWTSPTIQQGLAEEIAANARSASTGGVNCHSCTTLEQQRAIDRGNNQMMNDLYRAPSWHR